MMAQGIARRYARALMALAQDHASEWDEWLTDLADVLSSVEGRKLFFNPTISAASKQDLVRTLLADRDEVLYRFLSVVIQHGRERLVSEMAQAFHQMLLAREGYTEAVIETARELDAEERESAKAALDRFLGKKSWPSFRVAPDLIGGARVRFGDRMVDASVAGDLGKLRNLLTRANQSEVSR